jgi:DNA polymerase III delta subunit
MLTTVCGEDTRASREFVHTLKKNLIHDGYFITEISASALEEEYKSDMAAQSLFGQKKAYFLDNVSRLIGRKRDAATLTFLEKIQSDEDIMVINWESSKTARDLNPKKYGKIQEFKPDKSIFNLLDECTPSQMRRFLTTLEAVSHTQDEGFVFAMLVKHIRTLVLAANGALPPGTPPWQKGKLVKQASEWDQHKLIAFYEGLARIDVALKTGTNTFGMKKSLELLACYFF